MDGLARLFTDGNVIMKILFLQASVAAFSLLLLKKLLDRELFVCALEKIAAVRGDQSENVDDVIVVVVKKLPGNDEVRLRAIIKEKFPKADVSIGEDRALWGGLEVRAGAEILDFSLWTKLRQLCKISRT